MKFKVQLLDETAVARALTRISYEIVEKTDNVSDIVLIGIKTRGLPIAETIAENILKNVGEKVPVCDLDITFYRDDLEKLSDAPTVRKTDIPFDINGKEVILCDDVLFTGRTARAAIEAIFSAGRPSRIRLATLIDRGHRELPIRPDYIGKNVPTSTREVIKVNIKGTDEKTNVELFEITED